jgi:hypothetical protein
MPLDPETLLARGGSHMRFYTNQDKFYCGIDLHARSMYICILDQKGKVVLDRNYKASPEAFLRAIKPYCRDIAVDVECMFVWYWLAEVCAQEKITFALGHTLYIKAVHVRECRDCDALQKLSNYSRNSKLLNCKRASCPHLVLQLSCVSHFKHRSQTSLDRPRQPSDNEGRDT